MPVSDRTVQPRLARRQGRTFVAWDVREPMSAGGALCNVTHNEWK